MSCPISGSSSQSPAAQKAALIQKHRELPTQWLWEKRESQWLCIRHNHQFFVLLFSLTSIIWIKCHHQFGYTSLKEHVVVTDLLCDQWKRPARWTNTEIPAHQIMYCGSWSSLPPLFHRMYKALSEAKSLKVTFLPFQFSSKLPLPLSNLFLLYMQL